VYADKGNNTEKQYYVTDPHGNVVQLTDEKGKVTKTYEYDSFGNEVKPNSKDDNPFRYCGEYYDKETEEVYLRARYYQPAVGRFLTRDTYTGESDEPLSLHLYTYCANDGVNAWDSSGNKIKSSSSGKKWTKNNELSPSYAKQKGYAKVKRGKITKIKFHYNGVDHNINFGYGHVIAVGEGDIHKDDKKIWNKYLKGKNAYWWNINDKKIWVSVKKCNRRFNKDIKFIVDKINNDLPDLKVNQNQADALIDFRYNVGHLSKELITACEKNDIEGMENAIKNSTSTRKNKILKRFKKR
jgi:RHS repeat-associated protein